jgi:type II secretory pathway pseudopilin PulG
MKKPAQLRLIEVLIILAVIAVLSAIAVPNFLRNASHSPLSRVRADQRTVATALESFRVDHDAYPKATLHDTTRGVYRTSNTKTLSIGILPTVLSTPVAYVSSVDSFRDALHIGEVPPPLLYATDAERYVIISVGPDADYDTPVHMIFEEGFAILDSFKYTYDPTNGMVSDGDVLRFSGSFGS